MWNNNIKTNIPETVSEVLTVINLARNSPSSWLFWTRWWMFWFHELPWLPWLAEDRAGSEEGQCCMEFRRISLLIVISLSFGLFVEESKLTSLQGQKNFTAQRQDRVWGPHSLLSFGNRALLF
jgi:hypothetical protein